MKRLNILTLIAAAALVAMAFVGSSTALAESTALCTADENPCQGANQVAHGHATSVGKIKFLSSSNIECNVLFLLNLGGLANPLVAEFTSTFTNCNSGCTVSEENGPGEASILRTGHETASVTGEALVHLSCFGFVNCRYNGVGLEATAIGPLLSTQANGEVTIEGQEIGFESGTFCPSGASLDLTITPLSALYISS